METSSDEDQCAAHSMSEPVKAYENRYVRTKPHLFVVVLSIQTVISFLVLST